MASKGNEWATADGNLHTYGSHGLLLMVSRNESNNGDRWWWEWSVSVGGGGKVKSGREANLEDAKDMAVRAATRHVAHLLKWSARCLEYLADIHLS